MVDNNHHGGGKDLEPNIFDGMGEDYEDADFPSDFGLDHPPQRSSKAAPPRPQSKPVEEDFDSAFDGLDEEEHHAPVVAARPPQRAASHAPAPKIAEFDEDEMDTQAIHHEEPAPRAASSRRPQTKAVPQERHYEADVDEDFADLHDTSNHHAEEEDDSSDVMGSDPAPKKNNTVQYVVYGVGLLMVIGVVIVGANFAMSLFSPDTTHTVSGQSSPAIPPLGANNSQGPIGLSQNNRPPVQMNQPQQQVLPPAAPMRLPPVNPPAQQALPPVQQPVQQAVSPELMRRLDTLDQELNAMSQSTKDLPIFADKIAQMTKRIEMLEQRPAAPAGPIPTIHPPSKPAIISNWKLLSVGKNIAVIQGADSQIREVKVGNVIPNTGTVTAITKSGDDYLVEVDGAGVIMK